MLPPANRRAMIVLAAGTLIGWQTADSQLDRYLRWPTGRPASGTNPNVILIVLLFLGIAALATSGKRRPTGWTVPVLSLAIIGAYLCVPETGSLLLFLLPLAVTATGVLSGRLLEPGVGTVLTLAGVLAWVVVVDGQTRWASTIGALGCFAALLLARPRPNQRSIWAWPLSDLPTDRRDQSQAVVDVAVVLATIAVCSRVAGISDSTETATLVVAVTLATAWAVRTGSAWLLGRDRPSSPASSEELQGP